MRRTGICEWRDLVPFDLLTPLENHTKWINLVINPFLQNLLVKTCIALDTKMTFPWNKKNNIHLLIFERSINTRTQI